DWLSRTARAAGRKPLAMRDVLVAMIQAHEIQGCLALENSFNAVGLDHVLLVKVASTAVVGRLLGLTRDELINAVSNAFVDGHALRTYRHAPNTRAAERRLASSNAQIGEHVADYFPKVTLLGDLGFSATDPGHLFRKQNFTWVGAPYLQWNILDFGRTRGAVRAAEASRDEAEANYQKAVLGALQDANTALQRYGHQREHVVALTKVQTSAVHSRALMDQRYRAGVASMIDLLDTQR
ncbi:TolC family protein, partial [Burkholderia sola]|uniref:TolC family protein n=1 Tax=Burkholderia sola TaxID=2843302 RepID=UPI0023DDB398